MALHSFLVYVWEKCTSWYVQPITTLFHTLPIILGGLCTVDLGVIIVIMSK